MLASVGDKLASRTRRFGGAMTSWELGRHAVRQRALMLLAFGTSTLAQHQSWLRSASDQLSVRPLNADGAGRGFANLQGDV
jgi:hypothetical protein